MSSSYYLSREVENVFLLLDVTLALLRADPVCDIDAFLLIYGDCALSLKDGESDYRVTYSACCFLFTWAIF